MNKKIYYIYIYIQRHKNTWRVAQFPRVIFFKKFQAFASIEASSGNELYIARDPSSHCTCCSAGKPVVVLLDCNLDLSLVSYTGSNDMADQVYN